MNPKSNLSSLCKKFESHLIWRHSSFLIVPMGRLDWDWFLDLLPSVDHMFSDPSSTIFTSEWFPTLQCTARYFPDSYWPVKRWAFSKGERCLLHIKSALWAVLQWWTRVCAICAVLHATVQCSAVCHMPNGHCPLVDYYAQSVQW